MSSNAHAGHDLVSIIIICFNQGQFLGDAISSALAQSRGAVDIVVVDDGSTDNTAEVARFYPQVSYVYQNNRGVSAARNAGVRASAGAYLAFLDADDRLLPKAAEAGLRCLRENPGSGFVFGRYRKINTAGAVISPPNAPSEEADFHVALLQNNLIGMQSTVLYPRHVFDRAGGFDERLRSCEDYDLYLRIARQFPVHKHDEVVAEYRRHDHNMSQNYRSMLRTTLNVLAAQEAYASRDPRCGQALKAGISNWRNHYGRLMVQDLQNSVRTSGLNSDALRRLKNLASAYPRGIGLITQRVLRSMVHRSLKIGRGSPNG